MTLSGEYNVRCLSSKSFVLRTLPRATGVSRALRARNPKKSEKSLLGPLAPGSQKVSKKSRTDIFEIFSRLFGLFRDFFQTFWGPQGGGPGKLFSDFLSFLGPEGPRDFCSSREVCKLRVVPCGRLPCPLHASPHPLFALRRVLHLRLPIALKHAEALHSEEFARTLLSRGRQVGVGMGGGRNGCFWGAPILHLFVEKCYIFQGFGQKSAAPKTAVPTTTYPNPHLTPSDYSPLPQHLATKSEA